MGKAEPRTTRGQTPAYLRVLLTLVLVVGILYVAKPIIIPLALATLLTFILTPVVAAVGRLGIRRVYAVLLVVVLTLILSGMIGWGVFSQVSKLARDLPSHTTDVKAKISRLKGSGAGPVGRLTRMFHEIGSGATESPETSAPVAEVEKRITVAQPPETSSLERLLAVTIAVLEPVASTGLVLILVIFMLIKREDLRNRVVSLLGHGRLTGTTRVLVEAAQRLSRFLLMQLCVNASFGLLFGLALLVIGVPYWFLWAFLTAVLRFVPYIGSWTAAALPVLLSVAISPGWTQPVLALSIFLILDLTTANFIEPLLFGHSTGVSAVALLVAAVFWTWVWGPIGLVLSTPLTVCLVVLGQHVPRLRFLTLLLGDQAPLPPYMIYYQRLLAGDKVEAAEVAVSYAAAHGWDRVPDELFIPSLRLARRDHDQAGHTPEMETFILETTRDIVQKLAKDRPADAVATSTALAPEVIARATILSCPAHHQAEELTLQMLAGVMGTAGCGVEVISTRVLPVEIEARIRLEQPAVFFIAILPPGGLIQASYLCRRLHRQFPELKIVVGYWGHARNFDRLLVRLRSAGASYVTTSVLQSRTQIQALLAPPVVAATQPSPVRLESATLASAALPPVGAP